VCGSRSRNRVGLSVLSWWGGGFPGCIWGFVASACSGGQRVGADGVFGRGCRMAGAAGGRLAWGWGRVSVSGWGAGLFRFLV